MKTKSKIYMRAINFTIIDPTCCHLENPTVELPHMYISALTVKITFEPLEDKVIIGKAIRIQQYFILN